MRTSHPVKGTSTHQKDDRRTTAFTRVNAASRARLARNPTTSFLTATILIYAIGAGITAAAGLAVPFLERFFFFLLLLLLLLLFPLFQTKKREKKRERDF